MGLQLRRAPSIKVRVITAFIAAVAFVAQPVAGLLIGNSAHATSYSVCAAGCSQTSIQTAIDAASVGDTVTVGAGTYVENVNINKNISLVGAGAANTKIVATNANSTPLTFSTSGATVSGFTITHEYTATELAAWAFNNNGVMFNQNANSNTLKDSTVSLSRNGIYINNAQNNVIKNNVVTNNRTGLGLVNTVDGTQVTGNTISNNWTLGIVAYSATPSLGTNYSTVIVSGNTFDSNWYTEVEVKDTPASTGMLNVTNNNFSDAPVTFSTAAAPNVALDEPGYGAQKPNVSGINGTSVRPVAAIPTLRIYNSASVTLKYLVTPTDLKFTATNLNGTSVQGCSVATNNDIVIAHWAANGAVSSYNYRSWTTAAGSAYNSEATAYQTTSATNSLAGSASQGEGDYFFEVQAVAANGDTSPWSTSCKITYDKTAPAAPVLVAPGNNAIVNGATLVNSWNASTGAVKYVYESFNNAAATQSRYSETTASTQKTATNVANGTTFWWRVKAVDAQGNTSVSSELRKVTVDNVVPVITTNVLDGAILSGTAAIDLMTTSEAHPKIANIRILDANGAVVKVNGVALGSYDANNTSNSLVYSWDTTRVANGTYKLQFSAKDAAGNVGATIYRMVTVNNVAINSILDGRTVRGTTGALVAPTSFIIKIDGTLRSDVNVVMDQTQTQSPYAWSFVLPTDVAEGEHGIEVAATGQGTDTKDVMVTTSPLVTSSTSSGNNSASTFVASAPLIASPILTLPTTFGVAVTPTSSTVDTSLTQDDAAVLGAQTKKDTTSIDQAAKTPAIAATESGWKLFGILWYWWVLILAVAAFVVYRLVTSAKRRSQEA